MADTGETRPAGGFRRSMGEIAVLLLTLSSVTPASSLYVVVPGVITAAGTGAFLSLSAAAVIGLAMAYTYAELGSAFPIAGGEYAMVGRALGPTSGFLLMGMVSVSGTLAPAALSLGAADYLGVLWPGAAPVPTALVIIAAATLCGILNIRLNAWVTGLFLLIECLALVALTTLGALHPVRGLADLALHPQMVSAGAIRAAPLAVIGLATTIATFAYNGFGAAVFFSEEMHEAPARIGRTILWAFALTVAFEFLPATAVMLGAPDLGMLSGPGNPFTAFVLLRGGRTLADLLSLGVALAIVNSIIAIMLVNARFFYSSGRDAVWHGVINEALLQIHGRFESPWVATAFSGAAAAAACFIPFHLLLVLNGAGVSATYVFLCLAVIRGRQTGATAGAPYRMPLFPLAPLVGLAGVGYVLLVSWRDPDLGRPGIEATLAVLAAAAVYFAIWRRGGARSWRVTGPVDGG